MRTDIRWVFAIIVIIMVVLAGCAGEDEADQAAPSPEQESEAQTEPAEVQDEAAVEEPSEGAEPAADEDAPEVARAEPEEPVAEEPAAEEPPREEPEVTEEERESRRDQVAPPVQPRELPEYEQEATVVFLMGEADVVSRGTRRPINIGQQLRPPATVDVAPASYVEIQFDDQALFRIDENTTASLVSLMDLPRTTRTRMQLATGTIKATVDDVVSGGAYEVETETMVAGVRGTEFQVSAAADGDSTLAVREGEVSYLPVSVDPAGLLSTFEDGAPPRLELLIERLADDAPTLTSGNQVTIGRDDVERTARLVDQLKDQISAIAESPDTATFGQYDDLESTVDELIAAVDPISDEERRQTAPTRRDLEDIDTMNIQDVDPQSRRPRAGEIAVATDPPNSDIYIDGEFRGVNQLDGLFPAGRPIQVRVTAQGYEDFERQVTPRQGTPIRLNVQLERPIQGVRVEAQPGNAEVVINGRSYGRGTVDAQFTDGTRIRVEVTAPGYNPQVRTATVRAGQPLRLQVPLEETIADSFRGSAGSLVDELTVTPAGVVAVDEFGSIAALNEEGDRLWVVDTANSPMDRGFPVYYQGAIYLSGSAEFVVINAAGGNVVNREELPRERAHLFGRRTVGLGNRIIYPTDQALRVYSLDGELQEQFSLPGTALTTPAASGDDLVTVLQDGSVVLVNASSGAVDARIPTGAQQPVALQPVVRNGIAYFSGNQGTVVAVDLNGERVLWERDLASARVAVTHDLIVNASGVYAYGQGRVFALRRSNGSPLFEAVTGASAPPLLHEGILYVPMADESVLMVNAASGERVHSVGIDEAISTRPALSDGTIVAGTVRGSVIVINQLDESVLQ